MEQDYTINLANLLWSKYEEVLNHYITKQSKDNPMKMRLDADKKEIFFNNFRERYNYVQKNFMHADVESLDRHKISAIAIIAFILSDVLKYEEPAHGEGQVFMLKYSLAAQTGLLFMQYCFNNLLEANNERPIITWHWPQLLSCPANKYFSIFARNLYYTEMQLQNTDRFKKTFNELELADKLFLLEHITILHNKIDPCSLIDGDAHS